MATATTASAKPARSKAESRKRRPEEVKAKVLEAALRVFAGRGFEGATVQQIAHQAGVSVPLLVYHFQSKQQLWEKTVELAVARFEAKISEWVDSGLSATDKLKQVIAALVQVSAEVPEFHRLMTLENHDKSDRLDWLCQRFIKRHFQTINELIASAQREGQVIDLPPERLSHAIVGMATITSQAAEFELLTGRDLCSAAEMRTTIEAINKVVFGRP